MQKKAYYTKKLGLAVASGARQVVKGLYHVISDFDNKWSVVADGNKRATKVFSNQQSAIKFARALASRLNGQVVVHTVTGEVGRMISAA